MNSKKVMIVYRKELMEVLRDKRTLFTTLLLPVILYPLLIVGFNAIMARQTGVLEQKSASVAVQDSVMNAASMAIIENLAEIENYTILPAAGNAQALYENRDIQAIVSISDSLTAGGLTAYHIYIQYDTANEQSRTVYSKLKEQLAESEKALMQEQLQLRGVPTDVMNILYVRQIDTASSQRKMGMILGMFLPYIMIIMLLTGASVVAADLVAGEKERKTLETLLVSGIGRLEIVIGKYLTIITLAMLNLVINLFSISFSMRYMLSQAGMDMSGASLPLNSILILLAAMLPLATLFAAILLSL